MRDQHRGGAAVALGLAAAVVAASCGGETPAGTASAEINTLFPNESEQRQIDNFHVWVLRTVGEGDAGVSPTLPRTGPRASTHCGNLVGHAASPYDRAFELLADEVFLLPGEDTPAVDELPAGTLLVYLEAIDFLGTSRFSGCAQIELADGENRTVELELTRPGTFDCGDPAVDDDAPCDDGSRCTVGSRCRSGECTGGLERSCEFVTDGCNSGECTEEFGCQPVPLPDGTACEDDSACTVGNVCDSGVCLGSERDCSEELDSCQIPTCDESLGCTSAGNLPFGTDCDDGTFCTVETTCNSFGTCSFGNQRDCSEEVGPCEIPGCSEEEESCISLGDAPSGTECDDGDICTVGSQCNSDGSCVGGEDRDCDSEFTLDVCETTGCDSDTGCFPGVPVDQGTECTPEIACDTGETAVCNGTDVGQDACACEPDATNGNGNGA